MEARTIGIHLILAPSATTMRIPRIARREIIDIIMSTASAHACRHKESCVREDHAHILIEAEDEGTVAEFISRCMEDITDQVRTYHPGLELSDRVHVTLLPPWHLEIMASFIRDQDRYHEHRTLNEEINEIFRPNALDAMEPDVVN